MSFLSILKGEIKTPEVKVEILTIQEMLEELRKVGSPNLTTVQGQWWCYLRVEKGHLKADIDGERKVGGSLYDAVVSCYSRTKAVIKF